MKYVIPIPCTNANGKLNRLVYCAIFCVPVSPCSWSSSRAGTTAVNNWKIIDELIYAHNPTAIIENCSSDPPKSIAKYWRPLVPVFALATRLSILTKGTGKKTSSL